MAIENQSTKAVPALSSAIANNLSTSGISMPAVQLLSTTLDDKQTEDTFAAKEAVEPLAKGSTNAITIDAQKDRPSSGDIKPFQLKKNNTGLPSQLKSGIESLSGLSMDQVKVHYNSDKPAQLHARAFAQGSDIHLAPQQEQHLPHEAWHVVQQAQGRVTPTVQMKGKADTSHNSVGTSQEVTQLVGEGWAETIAEVLQIGAQQAQAFAGYLKDNYVATIVTGVLLLSSMALAAAYRRYKRGETALAADAIQQEAAEDDVPVEENNQVVAGVVNDVVLPDPDEALHDRQTQNMLRIEQLLSDDIAQQVLKEEKKTIQNYQAEVRFNLDSTRRVKEDKLDEQDSMIHYIPDLKISLSERYRQRNTMNSRGTVFPYNLQIGDGAQHAEFRFLSGFGVTSYKPDEWTNRNHTFANSLNTQGVITSARVREIIPELNNNIPLIYQIRDRLSERYADPKTGEASFDVAQSIDLSNATNRQVIAHIIGLCQITEARLVKLYLMSSEGLALSNDDDAEIDHVSITNAARAAIKAALLARSVPTSAPPAAGVEDDLPQIYIAPIRQGSATWNRVIQTALDAPGHGTVLSKIRNQLAPLSKPKFGNFYNHFRFYVWQEFRGLYELLNGGTMRR